MERRRHVLLVVWFPVGGIRTFLRYTYGRFDPAQYRLTVVLRESSELESTRRDLADQDVRFVVLPRDCPLWRFALAAAREIARPGVDLVHSQGYTSGVVSSLTAWLLRRPHILTSHDVLRQDQFAGGKGRLKRWLLSWLFRLPQALHLVSHDVRDNLLHFLPNLARRPERLRVIANGVDTEKFLIEERADLKGRLGLGPESFLIGYFGRFMPQKGFDLLVDAITLLHGRGQARDMAVAAFGWGGFIREEQAKIRARGLESYFHFLPFEPMIARALRGVDVVAMPSRWEACPLQPMETLVAGTPLIAAACVGLREVVRDTPARVVPVDDAEALAQALLEERRHPTTEAVAAYRQTAAARFDVRHQVAGIQALVDEVAGDGGRRGQVSGKA